MKQRDDERVRWNAAHCGAIALAIALAASAAHAGDEPEAPPPLVTREVPGVVARAT